MNKERKALCIQWKKAVSVILVLLIVISSVNAVPAKAEGKSIYSATPIRAEGSYTGWLVDEDYYTFTLSESGKITITISMDTGYGYLYYYDNEFNELDYDEIYYDSNRDCRYRKMDLDFSAGTYYFRFYGGEGAYSFTMDFQASGETFAESQTNPNDILSQAKNISLNKKYVGQLGYGDYQDFYKFNVPFPGEVSFSHYDYIDGGNSNYEILDSEGNRLTFFRADYDKNKGYAQDVDTYSMEAGDYYLKVYDKHGFYNFTIKIKPNPTKILNTTRNKTKATVEIEKLSGVTGYVLEYSTSSKFTKSTTKKKTVKSTRVKLTGLKKTKTYYLRVKAYKTWNGKTYYSDYGYTTTMYP